MAGISLTGLSSGLDTGSMVTQLMNIERQGRTKLEFRQANMQARTDALADVTSKLNALKFKASDLKLGSLWAPTQTAEASDPTKIGVVRTGGAGAGATSLEVLALASSSQRTFSFTSPAAAETWTFGSASVDIAAGATIDEAILAINGVPDTGVIAVNAGGRLVVSSTTTGAASTFAWTGGALSQDSQKLGVDAQYKIDGGAIQTSATNVLSGAVPGIEVTLKGITSSPVSVMVSAPTVDKSKVIEKLKGFVEAYNTVVDTVRGLTSDKKLTSPTTTAEARRGSLYGDNGLNSMLDRMRNGIASAVDGLGVDADQLAELGITTGAVSSVTSKESLAGKLSFDETKFNAKFAADPVGVRKLLGGVDGVDGISQRFAALIEPMTQTTGVIASRRTEADSELRRIKSSIERFDDRLIVKEERYRAQFAQMEKLLNRQQSIGADLANRLNQL